MKHFWNEDEEIVCELGLGRGDPIPGSKYVRTFCEGCGEPMGVNPEKIFGNYCEECDCKRPKSYNGPMKDLSHLSDYYGEAYGGRFEPDNR